MKMKLRIIAAALMLMLLPTCAYAGELVPFSAFCSTYTMFSFGLGLSKQEFDATRLDSGEYIVRSGDNDIILYLDSDLNITTAFLGLPTTDWESDDDVENREELPWFNKTASYMGALQHTSLEDAYIVYGVASYYYANMAMALDDALCKNINRILDGDIVFAYEGDYYTYFLRRYAADIDVSETDEDYRKKFYIMAVPNEDMVQTDAPTHRDATANEQ